MANFFGKAKPRDSPSSAGDGNLPAAQSQTEFEKTFKSFALKKDTELAPVNWFLGASERRGTRGRRDKNEIIVIDGEGDEENMNHIDSAMKDTSEVEVDYGHMDERG
jgi:chromatin assembly factor 1 subunit A